jgi:hypothetical protein
MRHAVVTVDALNMDPFTLFSEKNIPQMSQVFHVVVCHVSYLMALKLLAVKKRSHFIQFVLTDVTYSHGRKILRRFC